MIGKKRFKRIYIEITSACNFNCSFCKKTNRLAKFLTVPEFEKIISKVKDYTDYIYFHVMGEPLLNKDIDKFLDICALNNLKVNLVTNGSLLDDNIQKLIKPALRKITISLHSFEANNIKIDNYFEKSIKNAKILSKNSIVELRLWNRNSAHTNLNQNIYSLIEKEFNVNLDKNKISHKLADNIFLEESDEFTWPDINNNYYSLSGSCLAIKDQIAILSNGDVVPCCLDSNADIKLGNIFDSSLDEILNSNRAISIINGFKDNKKVEELCRHCNFRN